MTSSYQLIEDLVAHFTEIPHILIIDDDPVYLHTFSRTLLHCGCRVDTANNSESAIGLIDIKKDTGDKYDLIFLDLVIPTTHGPAILSHIRETMPKVPVVIVTGYPDSERVKEALRYGYLGLVQKPLNLEEIEMIFSSHKIPFPSNPEHKNS